MQATLNWYAAGANPAAHIELGRRIGLAGHNVAINRVWQPAHPGTSLILRMQLHHLQLFCLKAFFWQLAPVWGNQGFSRLHNS